MDSSMDDSMTLVDHDFTHGRTMDIAVGTLMDISMATFMGPDMDVYGRSCVDHGFVGAHGRIHDGVYSPVHGRSHGRP